MQGLYVSVVQAQRLYRSNENGRAITTWQPYGDSRDRIPCRLDLLFIRNGKDAIPALEAGRAPDRYGVLFADPMCGLRAGDRVVCIAGPIQGTFEIRAIPDMAQDYFRAHHMEVQVVETNQQTQGIFPSGAPA